MDMHTRYSFPLTVVLLAGLSQTAVASDEAEIYRLITPESTVSNGVGFVFNNNAAYFGEYNGMNQRGFYGLMDWDIVKRDNDTGTWYKLLVRDLALDDREMRAEVKRQGDWGVSLDYSEIPRYNPFTIITGLTGIGTNTNVINGTIPRSVEFETERKRFTLDVNKILPAGYSFDLTYKHEDKNGERPWGQGTFTTWNFLADPIDQTTQQIDAVLNYTGEKLQVSGGFYGTWFENANNVLNIPNSAIFTQMALPPSNSSYQAHVTAAYNFTPHTRGTFTGAYTYQIQDDDFIVPSNAHTSNLMGQLDTTVLQAGLTSQITPKLSILANSHYEKRNDETPIYEFFTPATLATTTNSTTDGTNEPRSLKTIDNKLQAFYQLPMGFRFTGGVDYLITERNEFYYRAVSYRPKTNELTEQAELRRALSDTVTGALTFTHADRWGSPWYTNVLFHPTTASPLGSNDIAPLNEANRVANTAKITTNWQATDNLSFQAFGSGGWVDYSGRDVQQFQPLGLQSGWTQNYSLDSTYVFSEKWQANAFYSRNDVRVSQITCQSAAVNGGICPATAANPIWQAQLRTVSDTAGFGMKGKITGKVGVGADVEYSSIRDNYPTEALVPPISTAPVGTVPGVNTQILSVKLNSTYAFEKNMGVRFLYNYSRFKTSDWTWNAWVYNDGTVVIENPNQVVNFFGVSYYFTFQ